MRTGRPVLRTTFQMTADILPRVGDSNAAMRQAIALTLRWMEERFGTALPNTQPPQSFERDQWGQKSVECISIPEDGLWTARLTHADEGNPPVAGRTWTTDVAFHEQESAIAVAVRGVCASRPDCEHEVFRTRPRIVAELSRQMGLHEVRPLTGEPWLLTDESDLRSLHALLLDQRRTVPVIMLTQPPHHYVGPPLSEYVLDARLLARRTQGVAHVVQMPFRLGYTWTDMVGKPWSVFNGAVRTYRAGLDFDEDLPNSHPRTFIDRIVFWRHAQLEGEGAFLQFLVDQAFLDAATKRMDWGGCLFVPDARSREAEIARERLQAEIVGEGNTAEEIAALRERLQLVNEAHTKEVTALRTQLEEAQKEAEAWSNDSMQAIKDRNYYRDENGRLRLVNDSLRHQLSQKTGETSDATIEIPDTYEDFDEWVERNLVGRVLLHTRALQGIKKARYEEVGLVYRCMLLLANEYRDMRLGDDGAKERFDGEIKRLGLRCGPSVSATRAGEEGDTYFVRYPVGSLQKRFLELHLRKGTTKDDRVCLAIYFFWDDATQQIVVGWLPSHLDIRSS